ncbi:MAG: peptide chain release factor N(5)-glutamine methyltransferase [Spirochaetia bacterium]|nr:peptide chain release factor N(5)-glutamine methyltransferase [Spirochaetia bacterium]
MTLSAKAALQKAVDIFKAADITSCIENPRLEAELLLAHILKITRSRLIIHSDQVISASALQEYEQLVTKKLTGIPTAYLLGNAEFFGRKFYVNKDVLIPRPETEELVEWILSTTAHADTTAYSILDLCAGSGCIGITLACEIKPAFVCLCDLSDAALKIAQQNLSLLSQLKHDQPSFHIEIIKSNLFNEIQKSSFNLIVSNPPYVTFNEYENLDRNVKNFEPREALLVLQPDEFNTRLVRGAYDHLCSSGWLYLETSPTLINSLYEIFKTAGFSYIETKKDLSGKERFIRGQKKLI